MEKLQISQDALYEYMLAHGVKMSRLAELIGKSDDVVTSCFKHHKDGRGKPRYFNAQHCAAISEALQTIASELRGCLLTWGSDQVYTNQRGATYDPALVEQIKTVGRYLNITALVERVLGWTKGKKSAVLVQTTSKGYGTVSQADMVAINNEILGVAGVLSSYEVVAGDGSASAAEDGAK